MRWTTLGARTFSRHVIGQSVIRSSSTGQVAPALVLHLQCDHNSELRDTASAHQTLIVVLGPAGNDLACHKMGRRTGTIMVPLDTQLLPLHTIWGMGRLMRQILSTHAHHAFTSPTMAHFPLAYTRYKV